MPRMLDAAEALRLMLMTLALGVTLPIMVQLFLLIRQLRKTIAHMSDQLEPSLRALNEIAQRPRESPDANSQLSSIVANLIPAAIAAFRAYRQHQHQTQEAAEPDPLVQVNCDLEPAAVSKK